MAVHVGLWLPFFKQLKVYVEDCFLFRSSREAEWEPIHPLLVRDDCFAYYAGKSWMRVGTLTADKQGCETSGHVIPVGQTLKPDPDAAGYYCYDEPDKLSKQTKKLWCLRAPEQPQTDANYWTRRLSGGADKGLAGMARREAQVRQGIDEGAQGVPLHATTPVKEAEGAARAAINHIKNLTPEDAENVYHGVLRGTRDWLNKPLREQVGDVAEAAGEAMVSPSTYIPGGMLGRETRLVADGAEAVADAAKAAKTATKTVKAADHAGQAVAKVKIHAGKQGKHIPGHNNFIPGKSELTHPDPQGLINRHAGTGIRHGNKEVVDFGETIGDALSEGGIRTSTTRGTIHYSADGSTAHIVPAKPRP